MAKSFVSQSHRDYMWLANLSTGLI